MVAIAGSTPDQLRHQSWLVRGTLNGALAKDMVIGPFIVAYAVQVQGLSNGQISWFLALVPLLVLARYPFLALIAHVPRVTVLHWARYVQISCLVALLVLPPAWTPLPVLMAIGVWFVFGNEFLQNAVWMNLVAEVSTGRDRGRFLGRLRMWKQATAMAFAVFGFVLVGESLSREEFQILLLVSLALLLNSRFWYGKLPATPPPDKERGDPARAPMWHILTTNPLMRRPLALSIVGAVLSWPILIVYLVGALSLPANLLMLTVVARMLGSIVSEVFWGLRADALGVRQVFLQFYAYAFALYPLLLFVPDYAQVAPGSIDYILGTGVLLAFFFARGVLDAGHMMAASMYRAQFLDAPGGFQAINMLTAIHIALMSAVTGLGGVMLVRLDGAAVWSWGPVWLDPFRLVTLAILALTLAAGLWLAAGIRSELAGQAAAGDSVS
ncbi:hypothetical protein C8N43_0960 [Litoreibacter ponti]|uniref:MFS transporter n=1 Tax=Litoreibacter ponti TaxID=1510457 RepID=A0A2T6BJS1_9RHOB|nr:hypothetical protein [Litoreibacter ponti]PTX56305.1 hypothetical protein C8N43_0960 [Litoreibacter ponti]